MSSDLVIVKVKNRVATLTMNHPDRLNGWTATMQAALARAFASAEADEGVASVVLTGTGRYYSAGVDLSGSFRLGHPRALRDEIVAKNYKLFDLFIALSKPILVAVNGVALGAPVTTAVLADGIVASDRASFSTPFARLGVPPEGCSSLLFPRLFGEEVAERLLGPEGFKPTAEQALEIGLVDAVVPHDELMAQAQSRAEAWAMEGRPRIYRGEATREELERVNARESQEVADAFLSAPFLMNQYRFLKSKRKAAPALTFLTLALTRPLWRQLL